MSVRMCECAAHRSYDSALKPNDVSASSAASTTQRAAIPAPPYIAPTRALLLHFSGFNLSPRVEASPRTESMPHVRALMNRSVSMDVRWKNDDDRVQQRHPDQHSHPSPLVLRLLGLSSSESNAAACRQQLLRDRVEREGLPAPAPAAAYPPLFGAIRIDLATNHPPTFQQVQEEIKREQDASASSNNNKPPQVGHIISLCHQQATSMNSSTARQEWIDRIVQHIASWLSASSPGATPSACASDIFLLHLDASMFRLNCSAADSTAAVQAIAEEVVRSIMRHLAAPTQTNEATSTSSHTRLAHDPTIAEQLKLLDSSSMNQPHLILDLLTDESSSCPSSPSPSPSPSSVSSCPAHTSSLSSESVLLSSVPIERRSLLAALLPAQTYRVVDGCIMDRSNDGWSSCVAYLWHRDTTRVPSAAQQNFSSPSFSSSPSPTSSSASPSSPLLVQGCLHVSHFIRELVFKLGKGSKYGA